MGAVGAAGIPLTIMQTFLALKGQDEEGEANKAEALANQELAAKAAADAIARGNQEASRTRTAGTKAASEQKVGYANSGVDPTVGTPVAAMAETRALTELDARTIENNALREAWGYKQQGAKFARQSELDQKRRENQRIATLLGGAGQVLNYSGGGKG